MNLIHNHRIHRAQRLGRLRGQHQVERLRRSNQDLRRVPRKPRPLPLRRISRAHADGRLMERDPHPPRHVGHPRQRRPQVPLHIHRQRLQRRNINHPAPLPASASPSVPYSLVPGPCPCLSISRSRHHRNAVSVFPLPVGARISALSPRAITGHPSRCGAVGLQTPPGTMPPSPDGSSRKRHSADCPSPQPCLLRIPPPAANRKRKLAGVPLASHTLLQQAVILSGASSSESKKPAHCSRDRAVALREIARPLRASFLR